LEGALMVTSWVMERQSARARSVACGNRLWFWLRRCRLATYWCHCMFVHVHAAGTVWTLYASLHITSDTHRQPCLLVRQAASHWTWWVSWLKSGLEQQSPGDMDSRLQRHHECLRKRPGMAICTRQGLVSDPMIAHMALRLVKIEQIWYVERISGGSISFFEDVGASTEWVLEWSETRCKNRATGLIRQLKDFVCAGLLFQMPSLRLLPDVVSFNAAIVACEQGNKWELAPSLLLLGRLAWLGVGRW
jgi:hypothetical protein